MARSGSNQKVANSLVAMSSAAVLAVYAAGYVRTRPAADRLAQQSLQRTMARQAPPNETALDAPPSMAVRDGRPESRVSPASTPVVSVPSPKSETAGTPKVIASSAPANVVTPTVNPAPITVPTETPAAIVNPAPAPMTSPVPAAEVPPSVPIIVPPAPAPNAWKDGKFVAWGGSPHGDIEATVVIENGRIVSAEITNCQTRYPCDLIDRLPPQVLKRQSANVDRISGATESADAFYSAVYFALGKAH